MGKPPVSIFSYWIQLSNSDYNIIIILNILVSDLYSATFDFD